MTAQQKRTVHICTAGHFTVTQLVQGTLGWCCVLWTICKFFSFVNLNLTKKRTRPTEFLIPKFQQNFPNQCRFQAPQSKRIFNDMATIHFRYWMSSITFSTFFVDISGKSTYLSRALLSMDYLGCFSEGANLNKYAFILTDYKL